MIVFANLLQPLIDASEWILEFFHGIGFGWGLSIIFMTVTIRLAILPLTFKGVKGMQELQSLQPEMKKLQERYKEDKQRLQQETMKLYQEHGVNPLASCLPILLQVPFFMALFFLLRGDFKIDACPGIVEFAQSSGQQLSAVTCTEVPGSMPPGFLFIPDLTAAATGGVLAVLIVLYVATQLGASAVSMVSAERTQRIIFMALPFVFVLFIINFPAGLILYWITTNIWTVGQQLLVRKLYPKPEPIVREDPTAKPARGKPQPSMAAAAVGGGNGANAAGNGSKAPPKSPRKKKKRSGRRR